MPAKRCEKENEIYLFNETDGATINPKFKKTLFFALFRVFRGSEFLMRNLDNVVSGDDAAANIGVNFGDNAVTRIKMRQQMSF